MREEGGQKIFVFVHGQDMTTVYAGIQCKREMQKPDERTLILPE